ncbi:hypothetical protein GCM10018987_58090 [Streptomyces cremeus]
MTGSARSQEAAAEALRAVVFQALGELSIPPQLLGEPWNTASRRTAGRAGFQRKGPLRGRQQAGGERRDMTMCPMPSADLS